MKKPSLKELNTDSPIYQERIRWPKWNVKVGPLMDPNVGGILLRRRLPHFTKVDHESAARYFHNESKRSKGAWEALLTKEFERVFGRDSNERAYIISGIGREEYSEKAKDTLRQLAGYASTAADASDAHWKAAGHRTLLLRHNPIKGPGKFEGELYITRYAHENPDEEIGSVDELNWFGRFSGKVKGRGPFHIITEENSQGFVWGKLYDSEKEMMKAWHEVEREYDQFYEQQGND